MRGGLIFMATLILSLAAGLGGYSLFHHWAGDSATATKRSQARPGSTLIGSHRPDFTLQDVDGNARSISEWDGKVILINFWATWCPPCRREIPALSKLYRELAPKGLVVVGAAIDDPGKVKSYVTEYEVPYPNLVGQREANRISAKLGNTRGSLPYTVIIDRDGNIRYIHIGEISRSTAVQQLSPLLGAG